MLKESLENFTAPNYGKTQRSPATYQTVAGHCTRHIERLVQEYHRVQNDQQLLREIRNGGTIVLPYHGEGSKIGIDSNNIAPGLFPEDV